LRGSTLAAVVAAAGIAAASSQASAQPVGPLPAGPSDSIGTRLGQLVAVALPQRSGGRVWRIAHSINPGVLQEVTEADVGDSVVVVFKATGAGSSTVSFALTRGERSKVYEVRRYEVRVKAAP
jgi:hypothetical protein